MTKPLIPQMAETPEVWFRWVITKDSVRTQSYRIWLYRAIIILAICRSEHPEPVEGRSRRQARRPTSMSGGLVEGVSARLFGINAVALSKGTNTPH